MNSGSATVVVIGAGGHGSEINGYMDDLAGAGWTGEFLGFVDDTKSPGLHSGLRILGSVADIGALLSREAREIRYLAAIGDNRDRRELVRRLEAAFGDNLRPWSLIHPTAVTGRSEIGEGTLLAPGAIVTSRTRVGRHCILNVKASVSHDCEVGDFVSLNPGVTVCGHCRIGDSAYIGAGATVIDRISIGEGAIIGAGAVVVDDIPAGVTAVGVPARVIKTVLGAACPPARRS